MSGKLSFLRHQHPTNLALLLLLLGAAMLGHVSIGAKAIAAPDVLAAFWSFDAQNFDHIVIRQMRVPRMLAAMAVGAALSVSGALMQGVTRNPLADPGVLGLMSGASFGVIVGSGVLGIEGDAWLPMLAAGGAIGAALLVFGISGLIPGGGGPAVLLLAGSAVSAFLAAVVAGINLLNEESFVTFRVWLSGAITNSAAQMFPYSLPWLAGGLLIALSSARQVTALSMGYETATGLGVNVKWLSIRLLLCVVVLTAAAVSIAGPLGFVGLVVPHATRLIVGSDYRLIVPCSAVIGAIFMLFVDVAARMVLAPVEVSTGVVTSLLGAPLFILLVRRVL